MADSTTDLPSISKEFPALRPLNQSGPPVPRELPPEAPIAIHYRHHDRWVMAPGPLEQQGFGNLSLRAGGFSALEVAGYKVDRR